MTEEYDLDGNLISEIGKIGTDKIETTYDYGVENRLAAVYEADELLVAMTYDGDGNRVFQLNYNLHTDEDWRGNNGNGNGSNKDNSGSGNSSGNDSSSDSSNSSDSSASSGSEDSDNNFGNERGASSSNSNNENNESGNSASNGNSGSGNASSSGNNGNSSSNGNSGNSSANSGKGGNGKDNGNTNTNKTIDTGDTSEGENDDTGSETEQGNEGTSVEDNSSNSSTSSSSTTSTGNGNATNAEENNSQNQSGILFPIDSEVSDTEQGLIDLIKTTGKQKNYELIEYINDVNREFTEVLVEQNINGKTDTSYIYGADIGCVTGRLSLDRFDGSSGYYLYDPRGSVTGVTNEEGQLYQSYRYNAYGEITFGAPQYENEYTYNGESYNPNIESQYLRARYYYVVTTSFLTEDSYLGDISEPLTLNRYLYCVASPMNYTDPSGHKKRKYIDKSTFAALVDSNINICEMESFAGNMEIHFGIEKYVGEVLYKLYQALALDGSIQNVNHEFFAVIASVNYSIRRWNIAAGTYSDQYTIRTVLESYGFTEADSSYTYDRIDRQHWVAGEVTFEDYLINIRNTTLEEVMKSSTLEKEYESEYNQFGGKVDLTHWASTLATYQNSGFGKFFANIGSNYYNPGTNANQNSGYVGDVYGTNDVEPHLTPDDYKSDLDSVNINALLATNNNLVEVFNDYYQRIAEGSYNRADLFVENVGKDVLLQQFANDSTLAITEYVLYKDKEKLENHFFQMGTALNFLINVTNSQQELQ